MSDKETFSTGAQRDTQTSKLRYDLIPIGALEALAKVYTDGAVKYGDNNWQKGMPFKRVYASLLRHVFAWAAGDTTERHMANAAWNCFALLHYEDMVELGVLPPELDDRVKSVALSDFHPEMLPTGDENLKAMQPEEWGEPVTETPSLDDVRRAHYFTELVDMGCSSDVAAQVVGGMTFSKDPLWWDAPSWVYIAGPMRGIPEFNFPQFDAARDDALQHGFDVISPADIDRTAGDSNNGNQSKFALRDFWSLYFIKQKDHGYNNIVMLPGSNGSVGAAAEKAVATWIGLKVVEL